jgi:hypothetical protein
MMMLLMMLLLPMFLLSRLSASRTSITVRACRSIDRGFIFVFVENGCIAYGSATTPVASKHRKLHRVYYYGDWNKQVHEEYKDGEIGSFSESILQLKNFLNVRSVTYDNLQKVNTKNFHPILIGRIYSIKFLSSGDQRKDIKQIFKSHLNIKNQEKVLIDFFYEPIMLALITKNFNLMGDIINFLSNKKVIFSYYQEAHKCQFDLMCLIFKFSLKKVKEKPNDFELMRNEIEHSYSYRDLFEMFVLVLEFHSQGKKEYTMKLYNKISKKLNYPLFSKDYLLRYFDK